MCMVITTPLYQVFQTIMSANLMCSFIEDFLDFIVELALQFYRRRRWLIDMECWYVGWSIV